MFALLALSLAVDPFPAQAIRPDPAATTVAGALNSWEKQSGIAVDRHGLAGLDAKFAPRDAATWPALQAILDAGQLHALPAKTGDAIVLVPRKANPVAAIDGPFRVVVSQVVAKWDAETDRRQVQIHLAIHWEPRLSVVRMGGLSATGLTADPSKQNVVGSMHRLTLNATADRSQSTIDLSGQVTVTVAGSRLRFTVTDLSGTRVEQSKSGVTAVLAGFAKKDDVHEATVELTYPAGLPTFESFEEECWLRDAAVRLTSADRTTTIATDNIQSRLARNGATLTYRFADDRVKSLGAGPTLTIEAPSPFREYPVRFSLKAIPLP
jgi:hypothetical protein